MQFMAHVKIRLDSDNSFIAAITHRSVFSDVRDLAFVSQGRILLPRPLSACTVFDRCGQLLVLFRWPTVWFLALYSWNGASISIFLSNNFDLIAERTLSTDLNDGGMVC